MKTFLDANFFVHRIDLRGLPNTPGSIRCNLYNNENVLRCQNVFEQGGERTDTPLLEQPRPDRGRKGLPSEHPPPTEERGDTNLYNNEDVFRCQNLFHWINLRGPPS